MSLSTLPNRLLHHDTIHMYTDDSFEVHEIKYSRLHMTESVTLFHRTLFLFEYMRSSSLLYIYLPKAETSAKADPGLVRPGDSGPVSLPQSEGSVKHCFIDKTTRSVKDVTLATIHPFTHPLTIIVSQSLLVTSILSCPMCVCLDTYL